MRMCLMVQRQTKPGMADPRRLPEVIIVIATAKVSKVGGSLGKEEHCQAFIIGGELSWLQEFNCCIIPACTIMDEYLVQVYFTLSNAVCSGGVFA